MYRTRTQHNSPTHQLSYRPLDRIAFASQTLTLYRPLVPQGAHPLISAAALFVSQFNQTRAPSAGRSANRAAPLPPLAHRLKTSTRRLRHNARRLSLRCKRHLAFIVAALHSASLAPRLRVSLPVSDVFPLDAAEVRAARLPVPLPVALSSQTMCQSPISTHEGHLVARFDSSASPPPATDDVAPPTKCDDVPNPAACEDPISPTCFQEPDSLISRTLTLYDWDDTFFPSTFLAARGVRIDENDQLPQSVLDELEELEAIVIKILQEALRCGVVKVITNAEEGWVELSGNRFMPKLTEFLKANQIKIVSARTIYEAEFPDSPSCWKTAAFAAEVDESYPDADELNVLVLGDSLSEREAAHNLALRKPTSYVKSVKLVERPNVTQLRRQIALLHGSFRELREHYGSFDVNLTC